MMKRDTALAILAVEVILISGLLAALVAILIQRGGL